MKNHILPGVLVLHLGLLAACQKDHFPDARSGVDIRLKSRTGAAPDVRPDGIFEVRGLNNGVSLFIPVAAVDPWQNTQRLRLPPGEYSVSLLPVVLDDGFGSLRKRQPVHQVLSQNPFTIRVDEGTFETLDVRTLEGAGATPARIVYSAAAR